MKMLLSLALVFCATQSHALDLEVREKDDAHLVVHLAGIVTEHDRRLADRYRTSAELLTPTAEPDVFTIKLDSVAKIASYLRAARLGGGIYIHLPYLCPNGDCSGVQFQIHARHILFGAKTVQGDLVITGNEAANSSVFLTNEQAPSLQNRLYVGPEFSPASVIQLAESLDAVARTYREISGRDLLDRVGIVATTAKNDGGYTGYGGDSLNIIRMTFDNPIGQSEEQMVRTFVTTFAHEMAHKLQTVRLHELAAGRLVAEGSADFLKVVVLLRARLVDSNRASTMVMHAYDECLQKRGAQPLIERIATKAADYREYYDCGMINYFAQLFVFPGGEEKFVEALLHTVNGFRNPPADDLENCLLQNPTCNEQHVRSMLGDAASLAAQRNWFQSSWAVYVAGKGDGAARTQAASTVAQ